jgi:hypothetical protein
MSPRSIVVFSVAVVLLLSGARVSAQGRVTFDIENGAAISGYNDVRIPGNTGTFFSITDDLTSATTYFWRVRAEVRVAPKHIVSVLAAPLTIDASGSFNRPVSFMGATFAAGAPVRGRYVFNSYRVSYRYEFVQTDNWRFGVGVTGKIRDAATRLESAGRIAEKTNVGFVPLVNFALERRLGTRATLQIAGDALAVPQGRAEDVFAGVLVHVGQYIEMHNALIGPYPYAKFALVENFWETGYGMPSFALLGPEVIRFPFILHSSYPHEILHNWWGNSVFVDDATGNWCEGLTAYLADHLVQEQQAKGAEYRRGTLQKHRDYVKD